MLNVGLLHVLLVIAILVFAVLQDAIQNGAFTEKPLKKRTPDNRREDPRIIIIRPVGAVPLTIRPTII